MAFWLDRFRREDEEDIWEELKQMLLNSDKYEAEKKLQEARELEAFNKAWDKANGVNAESASPKDSKGKLTGMATPALEGKVVYEKEPNIYEKIDSREDWSDELKVQKKAEVAKIQEDLKAREKEINKEYMLELAKNYGGAALVIGSAAAPGYGTAKLATTGIKYLGKKLAPKVGRKFAKQIEKSTAQGAIMGALEGAVRGSLEDENVAKTIAQDTLIGALGGATLGTALGRNAHVKRKNNLDELLDKRKDWGIAFTKQSGKPAEAIEKLLEQKQGFVPKATSKEGIGDIDFVYGKQDYNTGQGYGLEHIIDGRTRKNKIDGVEYVKSLPETFNNGVVTRDNRYPNHNYIEDFDSKIAIPNNWLGKKRNWVLTAHPQNKSASKRLAASAPMSKPNVDSRYNDFTTELTADNNIIQNSNSNLNPSQQSIQKPMSHKEWLEELKRRRKKGWW